MVQTSGQHFLHIPGPSPIPDRILRAISAPIIDHRSEDFARLGRSVLAGCQRIFNTKHPVMIYPASGTGAWEAAIVNTLSPGDRVLMVETGHFAMQWRHMAEKWGIHVDLIPGDWRHPVDPNSVEARLKDDKTHTIKAVMVVHNETSIGATSAIDQIRKAMDQAHHPALLMVDTVSGLGSIEFQHDEWGVDVAVACSQKGLMMPPGLGLAAISPKALAASQTNKMPRSFWDWSDMIKANALGFFPSTPATNLLYGLREAFALMQEEGLPQVYARHKRLAAATRAAVRGWGLEILCLDEEAYSPVLTAVLMPEGHNADHFREVALKSFDISLGMGLSKVAGKVFRIGHLGSCNDLLLMGALAGVEMSLKVAGVPHVPAGLTAARDHLTATLSCQG
jgi:alanine-glyoxylate transaminase/serine-glyoxylate transaminase/serine-pyruvate transaminase